jgi:hypothetical protein
MKKVLQSVSITIYLIQINFVKINLNKIDFIFYFPYQAIQTGIKI